MSSQPSNMSGLTNLGGVERLARRIDGLRGALPQAMSIPRYTAALVQLTADAMSGMAIGQLARRVLTASTRVLRADGGHVLEVDSAGRVLSVLASRGLAMVIPRSTLDAGHAGARLLESGAPMLAVSDYAAGAFAEGAVLEEAGVRSGLTALIRGTEAPYGFVTLYARQPRCWTTEETEFLQLAANVLSVAVATKVASDDRRVLMCRLVRAREEERKRIAVEIHDDAVQVMTAVSLHLAPLIEHLEGQEYKREGRQVQETVRLTIGRLRRLLFQLVPPELQLHGLASSVRLLLETLNEDSGVMWELDYRLIEEPAPAAALVVYRIVQEALGNVRKHAGASSVRLRVAPGDGGVDVRIEDDGCGSSPANPHEPGHLGVVGMGARAEMSGGRLRVRSVPGHGTIVEFWIPMPGSGELPAETAVTDATPARA
ncbi:MAG: GAF domain-containing sensor histidine kinase [Candidatus Dormiibacterota bacterium]